MERGSTLFVHEEIAINLVKSVLKFNPTALVVKNWKEDPSRVIRLIASYHLNLGDKFIADPFKYIDIHSFK